METNANKKTRKKEVKNITAFSREQLNHYEEHLHDVNSFGGKADVNQLIERYSKKIFITTREKKELLANAPESPDFEVLDRAKYSKSSCWQRKKYRSKVKDYFTKRDKYFSKKVDENKTKDKVSRAERFAQIRQGIEKRILEFGDKFDQAMALRKKAGESLEDYRKQGLYQDIESTPEAIDKAYEDMQKEEFIKAEEEIGEMEHEAMKNEVIGYSDNVGTYTGPSYTAINRNMRERSESGAIYKMMAHFCDGVTKHPLSRDLVVRRGVTNWRVLGAMMGLKDHGTISMGELKQKVADMQKKGGDFIVSEKAFFSTSLPYAEAKYHAGSEQWGGIEFFVLMKKGTRAANITAGSAIKDEREVLAMAGTKFKVLKVDYTAGEAQGKGPDYSWRVYLESIPAKEEGVERESA